MKKTIMANEKFKDVNYLYRVASVSMDRIILEKHKVDMMNTFSSVLEEKHNYNYHDVSEDNRMLILEKVSDCCGNYSCTINDETKVGTVMQKVVASLIAVVSKRVDEIVIDFEMGEKTIKKIQWLDSGEL